MKANDVLRRKESGRFSLSDFPSLQHPIGYGKASLPRWFISSLCQRIWLGHRQVQRDLMTVLAPPCIVATLVREETGLRAPSASKVLLSTLGDCRAKARCPGGLLPTPQGGVKVGRGGGLLKMFQTLSPWLLLHPFLPSTFCSLILQRLGSSCCCCC